MGEGRGGMRAFFLKSNERGRAIDGDVMGNAEERETSHVEVSQYKIHECSLSLLWWTQCTLETPFRARNGKHIELWRP